MSNIAQQSMPPLLEVRHLVKTYKSLVAVDDVSLAIPGGICFGLLGPNGAGKTTTVEMMEGIIAPDSGEVYYKGALRTAGFNEEIGIQFQHTELLSYLTVRETLDTFRKLYDRTENIDDLLKICNLHEIQKQYNDKISGGQRQRLLLALALVNRPALLLADEPCANLDTRNSKVILDLFKKLNRDLHQTIVMVSHEEWHKSYFDRIISMKDGVIETEIHAKQDADSGINPS